MKQKRWLIPAIVGVIILAAAGAAFLLSRPTGDMVMASVEIGATQKTELGLAADSSFTITTGWRVSQDELRAMLDIEPDIGDYTIGGSGRNWTLVPGVPLMDNTVYTIRVINPATKAVVQSFAFQTKSDLAVSRGLPARWRELCAARGGDRVHLQRAGREPEGFFRDQAGDGRAALRRTTTPSFSARRNRSRPTASTG